MYPDALIRDGFHKTTDGRNTRKIFVNRVWRQGNRVEARKRRRDGLRKSKKWMPAAPACGLGQDVLSRHTSPLQTVDVESPVLWPQRWPGYDLVDRNVRVDIPQHG